jgi:hypothetical protein
VEDLCVLSWKRPGDSCAGIIPIRFYGRRNIPALSARPSELPFERHSIVGCRVDEVEGNGQEVMGNETGWGWAVREFVMKSSEFRSFN